MNRAQRRHHANRIKEKTRKNMLNSNWPVTPRTIGRAAAMHMTHICWMCQPDPKKLKRRLFAHLKLNEE